MLSMSKFIASVLTETDREELSSHWHSMVKTLLLDDFIYKCDIPNLMSERIVDALLNLEFELKDIGKGYIFITQRLK